MSRITSAQVVAMGEYLEPDFDAYSLTVSQLLGILNYHNIKYPVPYSKTKLVAVFNEGIQANASKLKKERVMKANSIASDDGILDGATGQPLRKDQAVRRASRRLSRPSGYDEEEDVPAPRPEPPKRRRSSAQPALGGAFRNPSVIQPPAVVEESEPEEELPVRKVGRSKKTSEAAGAQARRVSNPPAEDSGWEDNNIFQSGAESSSPSRPSPVRPRAARKSVAPRKSRKSSSAPPQVLFSPALSSSRIGDSGLSPPQSSFKPLLGSFSPSPQSGRLGFTPSKIAQPIDEDSFDELDVIEGHHPTNEVIGKYIELGSTTEDVKEEEDNSFANGSQGAGVISRQQTAGEKSGDALVAKRGSPSERDPGLKTITFRLFCAVLGIATAYILLEYKKESASIGYCDTGAKSNYALEGLKAYRFAVEECYRENRTHMFLPSALNEPDEMGLNGHELTPCPPPPLVPWLQPEECTACPDHAKCTQYSVTCHHGYLLKPHPLLFFLPASPSPRDTVLSLSSSPTELLWRILSEVLDGLPGFGSVALPPMCVEDPKRKRNIGVLGKAIESLLGQERGRRVCTGGKVLEEAVKDIDGGEAKRWGVELQSLREVMKAKTPHHLLSTFDDTFNEAIQQLIQWGGVIIGEDEEGLRYVSHKTPDLTWDCVITVKSREAWAKWRSTAFGTTLTILCLLFVRIRRAHKRAENQRVVDLVQIALDTLRNQELAHHTDPVTAPQPYLSSLQLRDLILQDEYSVSSRSRIWDQVERIVEGNANVRANLQETQGGDEMRVWRWVGSAGRVTGVRNHIQPASNDDVKDEI